MFGVPWNEESGIDLWAITKLLPLMCYPYQWHYLTPAAGCTHGCLLPRLDYSSRADQQQSDCTCMPLFVFDLSPAAFSQPVCVSKLLSNNPLLRNLNQLQLGWESKRKGMFGVRAMETGPQTSLHHSPLNHHLQPGDLVVLLYLTATAQGIYC